jgi:hypothetical protein
LPLLWRGGPARLLEQLRSSFDERAGLQDRRPARLEVGCRDSSVTSDLLFPAGRVDNLVRLRRVARVPPHVVEAADWILVVGARLGEDLRERGVGEQAQQQQGRPQSAGHGATSGDCRV